MGISRAPWAEGFRCAPWNSIVGAYTGRAARE